MVKRRGRPQREDHPFKSQIISAPQEELFKANKKMGFWRAKKIKEEAAKMEAIRQKFREENGIG